MPNYIPVLRKSNTPSFRTVYNDFLGRKNPELFAPYGTQIYVGRQGSGKTISAVKHVLELKAKYPKSVIVSNLKLNTLKAVRFDMEQSAEQIQKELAPDEYVQFSSMDELAELLVRINNDIYGVIYLIDEIHTYFNSLDSKNIPMFVFTEISQQRKQRKLIIGTSQLFMRTAKALREQCDNIIVCSTKFGIFTKQVAYDGETLEQDYDGKLIGNKRKTGWFYQTSSLRNAYDTFQKVVSGAEQYDQTQRVEISLRAKKSKVVLRS